MLLRSTVFSYCVARHRWTAFSLRAPEMCLGTQYGCDDALHQWTMFSFYVTLHWRSTISFRAPERALGSPPGKEETAESVSRDTVQLSYYAAPVDGDSFALRKRVLGHKMAATTRCAGGRCSATASRGAGER